METRWADEKSALALPCCSKPYCGECWAAWMRTHLEAGSTSLKAFKVCPTPGCNAERSTVPFAKAATHLHGGMGKLCSGLLTSEEKRDLRCIVALDCDSTARRCPRCYHATSQRMPSRSYDPLGMRCERVGCGHTFCAMHGDLHAGETCAEFMSRTPLEPERIAFARQNHTRRCPDCRRGILKNGGCDHMRCVCGANFNWSTAQVEVPCNCLNLHDPSGKRFVPWGAAPCPGASGVAHLKLAAWRTLVGTAASPVLLTAAVAVSPFLAWKVGTSLWKEAQHLRSLQARARGLRPGTFEYNFMVHGEGRKRR